MCIFKHEVKFNKNILHFFSLKYFFDMFSRFYMVECIGVDYYISNIRQFNKI